MDSAEILSRVADRVIARQGELHAHQVLDATRTALVVIDMQNYFCAPGFPAENPNARGMLPAINAIASDLRSGGGQVVWVRTTSRGARERWTRHHSKMLSPERAARRIATLDPSHPGYQLFAGLDAREADHFIDKIMYSALIPGSSDLDALLRSRGVDTLLIAGTATNVCCESTARDAMMLDYGVVMLADATSASDPTVHRATLEHFALYFGDVMTVAEARARLQAGSPPRF
jgi:ureidoacrylate peracid hydrolase